MHGLPVLREGEKLTGIESFDVADQQQAWFLLGQNCFVDLLQRLPRKLCFGYRFLFLFFFFLLPRLKRRASLSPFSRLMEVSHSTGLCEQLCNFPHASGRCFHRILHEDDLIFASCKPHTSRRNLHRIIVNMQRNLAVLHVQVSVAHQQRAFSHYFLSTTTVLAWKPDHSFTE